MRADALSSSGRPAMRIVNSSITSMARAFWPRGQREATPDCVLVGLAQSAFAGFALIDDQPELAIFPN
jgi:hypothetical protein